MPCTIPCSGAPDCCSISLHDYIFFCRLKTADVWVIRFGDAFEAAIGIPGGLLHLMFLIVLVFCQDFTLAGC